MGPHRSSYVFSIPVDGSFTVVFGNCKSKIKRTATAFTVTEEVTVA
nr:MAG TPA: hypothetical protein [Caudoviricetes sp.]